MSSLATALFTAALALVGKIGFDVWTRYREYRGIAGALAGELSAYVDFLKPETTPAKFRSLAALDREQRLDWLRTYPPLPTSHPVFDKVVEKTGIFPFRVARGVSRTYNLVTGIRLLLSSMTTPGFLEASDAVQQGRLIVVAEALGHEGPAARDLIAMLHYISQQSFWRYVRGGDPQIALLEQLTSDVAPSPGVPPNAPPTPP